MDNVKDRIVQYANRYKLTNADTGEVLGTFDFDEVTGTVTEAGTEINKKLFDSIAADFTDIINGTQPVGAVGSTQLTNEDLNTLQGSAYWGKTYYGVGGNSVLNKPAGTSGFYLDISRGGVGITVHKFTATADTTGASISPNIYIRQFFENEWTSWEQIVSADGNYPTLGAGKSETLTEPFTVGKDTTIATTGYVKFASVSLPSAYRSASARFEVLDKNPVNAQTQMCGVEVVVKNTSTTNVDVVPRLLYGSSAYLSKIYACVKKGSYPVIVDLYFDITSSNPQETISCIKPLFTFTRVTGSTTFTFISDNEQVSALPTDTTNTQLSTIYTPVTEAKTATKALESNNNLLQNGDFTLNTQGKSVYPSDGNSSNETVDAWYANDSANRTGTIEVIQGGGIKINATALSFGIRQILNFIGAGNTYTLTVKVSEVNGNTTPLKVYMRNSDYSEIYGSINITSVGVYKFTVTVPTTATKYLNVYLAVEGSTFTQNCSYKVDFVKLEEGSISTAPNGIVQNATRALYANNSANAANVTTNINGKAISSIFESDGVTAKEATNAQKLGNKAASEYALADDIPDVSNFAEKNGNYPNMTVGNATKLNDKAASDIFESDGVTAKEATSLIPDKNGAVNPLGRKENGVVGTASTAFGVNAEASGTASTALGDSSNASGLNSTALGYSTTASSTASTALGYNAEASSTASTALGYNAIVPNTDRRTMQLGSTTLSALRCAVNLTVTSDKRDKIDIASIADALAFVERLNPVTFVSNDRVEYISDEDKKGETFRKYGMCDYDRIAHAAGTKKGERRRCGLLAQEVIAAMQVVYGTDNYANIVNDNFHDLTEKPSDVENKYTLAYANLVPFLIGAIKELNAKIKELEGRNNV